MTLSSFLTQLVIVIQQTAMSTPYWLLAERVSGPRDASFAETAEKIRGRMDTRRKASEAACPTALSGQTKIKML